MACLTTWLKACLMTCLLACLSACYMGLTNGLHMLFYLLCGLPCGLPYGLLFFMYHATACHIPYALIYARNCCHFPLGFLYLAGYGRWKGHADWTNRHHSGRGRTYLRECKRIAGRRYCTTPFMAYQLKIVSVGPLAYENKKKKVESTQVHGVSMNNVVMGQRCSLHTDVGYNAWRANG